MDKKQKADSKINEYAESLFHLRSQDGNSAEQKNVFSKLCEAIIQKIPSLTKKYNNLSEDEILDQIIDLIYYEFPADQSEKWNPEQGPFVGCYFSLLRRRINGYAKKKNETDNKRLNPTITADSDEEEELFDRIEDKSVQVEDEAEMPMIMQHFISLMNDEVKFKIKAAPNKFCYIQRFYTEWCARQILEPEFSNLRLLVSEVPSKYLDMQFASCFLDNQVSTASEIQYRKLKMLSEFTGSDKDKATPCGFDLKNAVYVQYVMQVTGKAISDSIVSNHRKAFYELLTMQSGKIGIGNHPIAES